MRVLSIARKASSLRELFVFMRNEGHPPLWYVLLYGAYKTFHSVLVLPGLSFAVAAAAAFLFLARGPFTIFESVLFLSGSLPFFEYSVMCRNYGISMLLLFWLCAGFRDRFKRPLTVLAPLFLLGLTNAPSVIVAAVILGALILEACSPSRRESSLKDRRLLAAFFACAAAIAAGLLIASPDSTSRIATRTHLGLHDIAAFASSFLRDPGKSFSDLLLPIPLFGAAAFAALSLFLLDAPALLACFWLAAAGLAAIFQLVNPGSLRQEGILYVFVIALLWIRPELPRPNIQGPRGPLLDRYQRKVFPVLFAGLLALLALHGLKAALSDVRYDFSSSRAFARIIRRDPLLTDAVLMGEPDEYLESLPYYLDNPIYFPRGHRFDTWTRFTSEWDKSLTLSGFLDAAEGLAKKGKPVVILLGTEISLDERAPGKISHAYGCELSWTDQDLRRLRSRASWIARLTSMSEENYNVFVLRPTS